MKPKNAQEANQQKCMSCTETDCEGCFKVIRDTIGFKKCREINEVEKCEDCENYKECCEYGDEIRALS